MMKLRDEQIELLRGAKKAAFVERAVEFARQSLPRQTSALGDDELAAAAELAIERAAGYGLGSELDLVRYLGMMLTLGFDFDSREEWRWVREILEDPDLDPAGKMPEIFQRGADGAAGKDGADVP